MYKAWRFAKGSSLEEIENNCIQGLFEGAIYACSKILASSIRKVLGGFINQRSQDGAEAFLYRLQEPVLFRALQVLPNMASIPEIKATHYNICGSIKFVSDGYFGKRQVALTHGPENVKPHVKRIDDTGNFCFEVQPGDYRISPLTTTAEHDSGLQFSPSLIGVTVNGPALGIEFVQ